MRWPRPQSVCYITDVQRGEKTEILRATRYRNLNTGSADKSLARPTSRCICLMVRIFRLMLVLLYLYIHSTNIPPILIINRIH